jgi:hypothetical protein
MSEGKKGVPVWVWFVVLVPLLLAGLGVGSALAIYGVRKYIMNAKQAEAQAALVAWGDGLVRCGEHDGKLPPSTTPVPASLGTLAGKKYQSSAAEWGEPAHSCAGFSMTTPQYFQYAWEQRSDDDGMLHALADLDGDGAAELTLELAVTCTAGKCLRGGVIAAAAPAAGASGVAPSGLVATPVKAGGEGMLVALGAAAVLGALGLMVAAIWLTVLAFQESVGWGLIALFVPCGRYVFIFQFFERCKKPALLYVASIVWWVVLGVGAAIFQPLAGHNAPNNVVSATAAPGTLPPPPKPVPIPELKGAPVDLSSVMGRARKLANAWQPDAALLAVEATLSHGLIHTEAGASAKITFGPSPFAAVQTRTGLFVVIYDQSGMTGAPTPGKAGPTLIEPMCAPEGVVGRVTDLGDAPFSLSYGLDPRGQAAWMVSTPSQPKLVRYFSPQDCQARVLPTQRR